MLDLNLTWSRDEREGRRDGLRVEINLFNFNVLNPIFNYYKFFSNFKLILGIAKQ